MLKTSMNYIWNFIKNLGESIWKPFATINTKSLGNSCAEVLWMTAIAFCPLVINILIAASSSDDLQQAFIDKIVPGELLSYCMSFLAPSLYLLVKTHGTGYSVPLVKYFSIFTVIIYLCSVVLYLVAKNNWVKDVDMHHHGFGIFFKLSVTFLVTSVIFRIFSIYHGGFSNWSSERKQQQEDFNKTFAARLKTSK